MDELEERIDRWIAERAEATIGDMSPGAARWTLLAISADFPKNIINHARGHLDPSGPATRWLVEFHRSLKYGLKLLEDAAPSQGANDTPGRLRITDEAGGRFSRFRADLEVYDQVCRLVTAARSGVYDAEVARDVLTLRPRDDYVGNHVFELMRPIPRNAASARLTCLLTTHPLQYLEAASATPSIESIILSRTGRRGRYSVDYRIEDHVLADMVDTFVERTGTIPAGWSCGLLSEAQLRRGFSVLKAASYYNAVAAWGGGLLHRVHGAGVEQAVLVVGRDRLRGWLRRFADLDDADADEFMDLFIRPEGGDPALQPIVLISGDRLALDPLLLLASDDERNWLKLLARKRRRQFDASSAAFEDQMMRRLAELLRRAGWRVLANEHVGGEEIDVLAGRDDGGFLLVIEAKWEIRAADPFEMKRSRETSNCKRGQVARKSRCVARHLADAERRLDLDAHRGRRTVLPLVVLDGGIGLPSAEGEPEVVPIVALASVLAGEPAPEDLASRLRGQVWMPREGEQFTRHDAELDVANVLIRYPGFEIHWERAVDFLPSIEVPWHESDFQGPERVVEVARSTRDLG